MTRLKDLNEEQRKRYLPLLEKVASKDKYDDYYLTFDSNNNPYWIYYPNVDFIDYL